jgi:serine/threonine protein kinase
LLFSGAPECYRYSRFGDKPLPPPEVTAKVDVWSAGCILAEAATWLVDGLDEFRHQRRAELKEIPNFQDSDCFHNGSTLLNCVKQYLHHIRDSLAAGDKLTKPLLGLICDRMLQPEPSTRITASFALHEASNLLEKHQISMQASKKKEPVFTEQITHSPPQIESRTPIEQPVDSTSPMPRLSDEFRSNVNLGDLETTSFGIPRAFANLEVPGDTLTSGNVTQTSPTLSASQEPLGISNRSNQVVGTSGEQQLPKWSVKEALKWKSDFKAGIGSSTLPFESYYADLRDRDFVGFISTNGVVSFC